MDYFDKYAKSYDFKITEISYKYYHSYRVKDLMIVIAKSMNLPIYDVELAGIIGLLHDIGRFPQFERFHSFDDSNIDHGDLGEEILRKDKALKNYDIKEEDYEVVYKAIRNHNKYKIEDNLTKRELLFSKMIRDADKLDIIYAVGNSEIKSVIREDDSEIRDVVSKEFFSNKQVTKLDDETDNENIVIIFSFIYDINFGVSFTILKYKKYYEKLYDRLKNKELFKPYIEHLIKYINERVD